MTIDTLIAYHYTTPSGWKRMQKGRHPGLKPYHQLIPPIVRGLNDRAYEKIAFALDTPMPSTWANNDHHQAIWLQLVDYLTDRGEGSVVLLELSLPPGTEASVVDRCPLQRVTNSCYSKKRWEPAFRALWRSRVSYTDYKADNAGSHCLPEIVIFDQIPLENINVVWKKPVRQFLEEAYTASTY